MSKEDIENIPEDTLDESQDEKPFWRPPKWTDVEALKTLIDEYFFRCEQWYVRTKINLLYDDHMEEWKEAMQQWRVSCASWKLSFKTEDEQKEAMPREPKKEWKEVVRDNPTITWLALHLWCEIETIKNYSKKDDFSAPIKEAYLKVQRWYEERLQWTTPTWAIFALKNFEWKDKTETDHTTWWQPMFWKVEVIIDDK